MIVHPCVLRPRVPSVIKQKLNKVEIKLNEIVKSNYYYNLDAGCVKGLPHEREEPLSG
jgi:hypothetical protein